MQFGLETVCAPSIDFISITFAVRTALRWLTRSRLAAPLVIPLRNRNFTLNFRASAFLHAPLTSSPCLHVYPQLLPSSPINTFSVHTRSVLLPSGIDACLVFSLSPGGIRSKFSPPSLRAAVCGSIHQYKNAPLLMYCCRHDMSRSFV